MDEEETVTDKLMEIHEALGDGAALTDTAKSLYISLAWSFIDVVVIDRNRSWISGRTLTPQQPHLLLQYPSYAYNNISFESELISGDVLSYMFVCYSRCM